MFFKSETKKIFGFRLFWIMIAVFLAFNTFLVVTNYRYTGYGIRTVNSYVQSGIKPVDDEYGFCEDFDYAKENAVNEYYDNLSAESLLKLAASFRAYKNSDTVNKIVERNYKKVDKRIQQIMSDGEAEDVYYVGTTFGLHNELYGTVLHLVMTECFLLAILITAYLMNYEEIFHTHQNVYSSKRGRSLVFSKGLAAVSATAFAAVIIIAVTIIIFFYRVPHLWSFLQSSVSSAMATENRAFLKYPFITWIKMSQFQYLLAAIALMIVYTVLASLITFAFSFVSKNAFINSALTAVLYFAFFTVWFGFENSTVLSFVQVFNPSIAMYNLNVWFMEYVFYPMTSYQGYETAVAVTYIALTIIVIIPLWKHFKNRDIS